MDRYLFNQNKITKKNYELQTQLATNSKINTISDDLSTSLELINMNSQIKKNETFKENIEKAKEFVGTASRSFDSVISEIQKIMVEVTSAGDVVNKENIPSINERIKNSLDSIVQSLNVKYNGMYIFGGTNYQSDPFGIDADGKGIEVSTDMSGKFNVQIGPSSNEQINIPGDKIVDTNIISTINDIIDTFTNGQVPDKILQDKLDSAYNDILALQSSNGNKLNKLYDLEDLMTNQTTDLTTLFAKKQEVDVAQVMVELQNQDYLLQMSYKLASSILPKSLLDYL